MKDNRQNVSQPSADTIEEALNAERESGVGLDSGQLIARAATLYPREIGAFRQIRAALQEEYAGALDDVDSQTHLSDEGKGKAREAVHAKFAGQIQEKDKLHVEWVEREIGLLENRQRQGRQPNPMRCAIL